MTSIERTAYPRFKRLITAHELHLFFAPTREEAAWAAERMDSDGHQLALLLALKSYQRMGRFPKPDEYPEMVVDFVRRTVELPEGTLPSHATGRTAERQRTEVRQRVGTKYQQTWARQIAEAAIRKEAVAKNRPADLINIALEKVMAAGLELPAFSTFDTMTSTIRAEVNASICRGIHDRMSAAQRAGLLRLPDERDSDGTTPYNRLKQTAQAPTWSHFKRLFTLLEWLDELGTPRCGWTVSRRRRSPTSPGKRMPWTPPNCGTTRSSSGSRCWPAWPTRRGRGCGTTWRRCSASGSP
ncbi:DUF4158 domain-containing protein [Streptomyces cyaneofuscatus]|uniref:DUF4158 domain-containing protein n=1 Tax=Streptomyces cyaneofuscatus TaxID=66883 RepID=UPI003661F19B